MSSIIAPNKNKKILKVTKAQFAEKFLYLNGRPLSLDDYPHMRAIYNCSAKEVVMQFSRQTAKSTTLANMMLTDSIMASDFKSLYVAPTVDQTKVFSHDRVAPVVESSPLIKNFYTNSALVQNVFMKQFTNRSKIYMRYALLSADRLRGYSADVNYFDECQDLLSDIIPVVQETMSRSMIKRTFYTGTPKRTVGTLASIWDRSTQNEYMPHCTHCGVWNRLDEDNIGEYGVICKKCGKPLDIRNGQWISTGPKDATVEGFRVCLLNFANAPWVDWQRDVIEKRKNVSRAVFYNETLGLPYDDGVSPITKADAIACCTGHKMKGDSPADQEPNIEGDVRTFPTVMGIDYGPVNSEKSFTVVSIVQRKYGKFHVVYAKRFVGKEADYSFLHDYIPKLFAKWNCKILAADYGMGEAPNSEFRRRLGYNKVIPFQHMANQKQKLLWNNKMPAYTTSKNGIMTEFFQRIKMGEYVFPHYSTFETFVDDLMNVQNEFDETLNKMKFINIGPDDFAHATIFASVAAELLSAGGLG